MKPAKTIEDINKLFTEYDLPQCSDCKDMNEIYNVVEFILKAHKNARQRLSKIEQVIEGRL